MSNKEVEFHILPLVQPTMTRDTIDIEEIRRVSSHSLDGFPVEDRAFAWLAMLGLYPKNPEQWNESKIQLNKDYWDLVPPFLSDWETKNLPNQMSADQYEPFGIPKEHCGLMALIHGDIVRTGRTIFFFPPEPIPNVTPAPEDEAIFQFSVHCRRLERILFTFAFNHKGLGYMQGFNELLPPFYYVLLKAINVCDKNVKFVEAFSFHCFQTLLIETDIMDLYNTSDKSSIILHKLNDFNELMKKHLPREGAIINSLNIQPLFYCYRWFNLMFSQEHDLPYLLGIWDDLLAHFDNLVLYLYYLGIGHIYAIRDKIEPNNTGGTLFALQNLEIPEIKAVIEFANKCWNEDHSPKKSFFSSLFK